MPVVGYVDDRGGRVTFADVRAGKGHFVSPLPFVLSMVTGDSDPHDYVDISASRIANGLVRQGELLRRHDVFVPWRRQSHAWLGRAAHEVAAKESLKLHGNKFTAEISLTWRHPAGLSIGGRPDSIDHMSAVVIDQRLDIDDLKVTGAYTSKAVKTKGLLNDKPDWFRQLNLYRWLAENADDSPWRGKGLTARSRLQIHAVYRDWSINDACPPIEPFTIPLATDETVRGWIDAAVTDYLRFRDVPDDALPPCPVGELWFNGRKGIAQRCANYCAVSGLCNQWALVQAAVERSAIGQVTLDMLESAAQRVAAQTKRG